MRSPLAQLCMLSVALGVFLAPIHLVIAHSDGPSPYGTGNAPDVTYAAAWNSISFPAFEGTSPPGLIDVDDNGNGTMNGAAIGLNRREAQDFYLRVMPLGASITQGLESTDGNGYRKWLRSQLRWKGWKINMVGSLQNGNMADKDHEGHSGWIIDQIHGAWQAVAWMKPNLVLINAGTNDCNDNIDTGNAGARLKVMVDDIFQSVPGVTVVVSTLVRSRDHDLCASDVSQQYRNLVNSYSNARIGLADIYSVMTMDELGPDGIHPTDYGYELFASVWWSAISKLESGMRPPAQDNGIDDGAVNGGSTCAKVAGNARGPIQSQVGSGHDDGIYVHNRIEHGPDITARIEKRDDPKSITDAIPWHMFFANIIKNDPNSDRSQSLDDWIRVFHDTNGVNTYYFRQNLGGGKFGPSTTFDVDMNCDSGPLYAFADFNNDGLDDFFCLQGGSAVSVSLNRGGSPPRFESIGQVVPTHDGYSEKNVRIADIDGDGRADYCLVASNGNVLCSRNGGQGDSYNWQGFSTLNGLRGVVFDKKQGVDDISGVQFGDINGDYRSDYFFVGDNGNVETWINNRGWGSGIVPDWRPAGITHGGQPATGIRGRIKFGRIYGSNRLDYIYLIEHDTYYDVKVWENKGGGGTKRKADGNFYCDMRGTGADDYVWIYEDGHAAEIFANIHSPPDWGHNVGITFDVSVPATHRVGIHLADWNGDGRCDVLVQNKANGALTLWENHWDVNAQKLTFVNVGVINNGAVCSQGWGVGIFDRGMRLHDIDGDKRADILCLELNGRVTAWLNQASGLLDVGQVKFSEGWDRSNMRFADVEHSGRADLIHLDKYTGAAQVFKNNGHTPGGGGSSFSWTNRGVLYSPIDRGETMHFTNQGGLGRADLLHVLPASNQAWTYFNECGGTSGGDDGPITDPGLPGFPGDPGGGLPPASTPRVTMPGTNFPDPSIVLDPYTGDYYSFATAGNNHAVQTAAKFRNESDWHLVDVEPLKTVGGWALYENIWAPDVVHIGSETWVMYYSAPSSDSSANGKHCVGAAVSTSGPLGPYSPRDGYIYCDLDAGGAIDPSGYYDEATDTRWVVYKVDGNNLGGGGKCGNGDGSHSTPIMLQELELDGFTLKGEPRQILDRGEADGPLIEAPNLVYENGLFLLFFSSNCYNTDLYDISYATATSIYGPFVKASKALLLTGDYDLRSPGGASSNANGHLVFHGYCGDGMGTRCMYEVDYNFQNGIVTIG